MYKCHVISLTGLHQPSSLTLVWLALTCLAHCPVQVGGYRAVIGVAWSSAGTVSELPGRETV